MNAPMKPVDCSATATTFDATPGTRTLGPFPQPCRRYPAKQCQEQANDTPVSDSKWHHNARAQHRTGCTLRLQVH
eukprot:m.235089 g.235089  ORF g.235089 m.235089 type:complete len:75 (+) comp26142_c0_seq3:728-952(+)